MAIAGVMRIMTKRDTNDAQNYDGIDAQRSLSSAHSFSLTFYTCSLPLASLLSFVCSLTHQLVPRLMGKRF